MAAVTSGVSLEFQARPLKATNEYVRWNLLFTVLIFLFLGSCFWIPFVPGVQRFALEIVVIVLAFTHGIWLLATVNAVRNMLSLRGYKIHKIDQKNCNALHLIGICLYKEPLELMIATLGSCASQKEARTKIAVVVGMEEGTPDRERKTAELRRHFEAKFKRFMVAVHPRGISGEIPGKCSNLNYAMRMAVAELRTAKLEAVEIIVTTGDCDTIFGDRYFDALEEDYFSIAIEARLNIFMIKALTSFDSRNQF